MVSHKDSGSWQRQRLFFALWPDAPVQARLAELGRQFREQGSGGRCPAVKSLHLTLLFLGAVRPETRACLESMAGRLRPRGFRLRLHEIGYWRRPRVVWAGCPETPPALLELAEQLKRGARDCGLEPDTRPFRVHLTLLRQAGRRPSTARIDPPIFWEPREFVLVQSFTRPEGAEYRILQRWPLVAEGEAR